MSASAPSPPSTSATQRTWRNSLQWQTLLLTGAAWSVWPVASVTAILLSYIVGLGLANWLLPRLENAPANDSTEKTSNGAATSRSGNRWWWVLLAIAPVVTGGKALWKWPLAADWTAFRENVSDRLYLETVPAIMPRLVVSYQPQRFLIQSPGAEQVEVQWIAGAAPQTSVPLGNGLFLIDLDPRRVPELARAKASSLDVSLIVDGSSHSRQLELVHPQPHPRWFHSLPDAGIAATVSEETDEAVLVRRDGSFQQFQVDDGPTDAVLLEGGSRLAVAHRFATELWILDARTGEPIKKLAVGMCQNRLALSPDGRLLAVAMAGSRPGIQFVSTARMNRVGFCALDFVPDWLQFGRDERELVVTDRRGRAVVRLEQSAESTRQPDAGPADTGEAEAGVTPFVWQLAGDPIELARPVAALCRSADGRSMWLASTAATTRAQTITANHFVENALLQIDVAAWRIRGVERTDRRSLRQDGAGDTELGVAPLGLAPYGEGFIAAFSGSSEAAIAANGLEGRLRFESTARHSLWAPHGVADLGERVWCVSSPSSAQIGVLRGDELLATIALGPSDDELASHSPRDLWRRRGEQGFYESTRAGLACQSCHLHLGPDYSRHNIGQDVDSDSLTVRGIAGTSPYLRDGSNAGLRSLHEVTESVYRGYRRSVPWDRREALAAFLTSLPAEVNPRQFEPLDATRMRKGHAAFRKAECHRCHEAPAMTNLGQHPVRQLFPDFILDKARWFDDYQPFVDTPSLRGVSLHPPYLHDGRAATLTDVLREHNRADQHGRVSGLLPSDFDDLLYFLGQL